MKCLHTLRHTNIVAYYGAWIEDNHSYILMEYATRGTLKDLLENNETPLKEEVRTWETLHLIIFRLRYFKHLI